MKNVERLIVDAYMYGNDTDVKLAKEEKKTVEYLESKINYENLETTLKIYDKAIKERIFKTPVGFEFLKNLRLEMLKRGMPEENIQAIPLYLIFSKDAEQRTVRIFQVKEKKDDNVKILRMSLWMNIALIILVIGMFLLTMFGNTTNIMNYKYKLENEYSIWKQELDEREAIIREKEAELRLD